MKKFRLLKDLPGLKAGEIFEISKKDSRYYCHEDIIKSDGDYYWFSPESINENPDFFEEIKDIEVEFEAKYSEADMLAFGSLVNREDNDPSLSMVGLLSTYKAAKFFPKEEPKERSFTTADMVDFGRYIYELIKQPVPTIDTHTLDRWVHNLHPGCSYKEE